MFILPVMVIGLTDNISLDYKNAFGILSGQTLLWVHFVFLLIIVCCFVLYFKRKVFLATMIVLLSSSAFCAYHGWFFSPKQILQRAEERLIDSKKILSYIDLSPVDPPSGNSLYDPAEAARFFAFQKKKVAILQAELNLTTLLYTQTITKKGERGGESLYALSGLLLFATLLFAVLYRSETVRYYLGFYYT
jgi:hypothetical protein